MNEEMNYLGYINIFPPLNIKEIQYLKKFSNTRRMDRRKGPYYVCGGNEISHTNNKDVIDYNTAPQSQPGLWCKWTVSEDGTKIKWNGYKKFYAPKEWLEYLIVHFLGSEPVAKLVHPNKFDFLQTHILNGKITVQEDDFDYWFIMVDNNHVSIDNGNESNPQIDKNQSNLLSDILVHVKDKKNFSTSYEHDFILLHTENGVTKYLTY